MSPPLKSEKVKYFTTSYDSTSEAFWCTEHTAKNLGSIKGTVLE